MTVTTMQMQIVSERAGTGVRVGGATAPAQWLSLHSNRGFRQTATFMACGSGPPQATALRDVVQHATQTLKWAEDGKLSLLTCVWRRREKPKDAERVLLGKGHSSGAAWP